MLMPFFFMSTMKMVKPSVFFLTSARGVVRVTTIA